MREIPIVSVSSNLPCLDDPSGAATPGTKLQLWYDNGAPAQQWRIARQADGSYKLTNVSANLCLDDPGGSTTVGTVLQLWTDNGALAQRWQLLKQ